MVVGFVIGCLRCALLVGLVVLFGCYEFVCWLCRFSGFLYLVWGVLLVLVVAYGFLGSLVWFWVCWFCGS